MLGEDPRHWSIAWHRESSRPTIVQCEPQQPDSDLPRLWPEPNTTDCVPGEFQTDGPLSLWGEADPSIRKDNGARRREPTAAVVPDHRRPSSVESAISEVARQGLLATILRSEDQGNFYGNEKGEEHDR